MSAPVITSSLTASINAGSALSYQITASDSPTSYNASNLPSGVNVDASTGLITGIPVFPMAFSVGLSAVNADGTGTATLVLTVGNPAIAGGSYRAARLAEFNALVASEMYGTTFAFKGNEYPCICPPIPVELAMRLDDFRQEAPIEITMYATNADFSSYNFETSGLTLKDIVTARGYSFQINRISLDDKEPTVKLWAVRKQ